MFFFFVFCGVTASTNKKLQLLFCPAQFADSNGKKLFLYRQGFSLKFLLYADHIYLIFQSARRSFVFLARAGESTGKMCVVFYGVTASTEKMIFLVLFGTIRRFKR